MTRHDAAAHLRWQQCCSQQQPFHVTVGLAAEDNIPIRVQCQISLFCLDVAFRALDYATSHSALLSVRSPIAVLEITVSQTGRPTIAHSRSEEPTGHFRAAADQDWRNMSEDLDATTAQASAKASIAQVTRILEEMNAYDDPQGFFDTIFPRVGGPEMISKDEATRQSQARCNAIFENWDTLKEILSRHEATVQARWLKKNAQQRAKILLAAKPTIPASHRPDFEACRAAGKSRQQPAAVSSTEAQELGRHAYMLPHINLEDLSKPLPLLLLLSSRKHHPSIFAAADQEAMCIGVGSKKIVPIFLYGYVMMLNGVEGRADYGRLVSFEEHPDATQWWDRRQQLIPGEGLLVLEAQEYLLQFLVQCCRQILHDIPSNKLLSATDPKKPDVQIEELRIRTEQPQGGLWSLSDMALEAPYRVPANLSLPKLEALLSGAAEASEDHLWSLREDPSYFHETVHAASEHDIRRLKDKAGQPHPHLRPDHEHIFWYHVTGQVVFDSYMHLDVYSTLWQQSQRLQTIQKKHIHNISQSAPLPDEYLDAVLELRYSLKRAMFGRLELLVDHAVPSPHLRRFYERKPSKRPDDTGDDVTCSCVKPDNIERRLLWLLETLWIKSNALKCLGPVTFVDELQRLLDAEPKAANMITPLLSRDIGALAILTECLRQIEMYHPWAMAFDADMESRSKDFQQRYSRRFGHFNRIWDALDKHNTGDRRLLSDLGKPIWGRFDYPAARRPTQENIEQMRSAEANLDAFWAAVDRILREDVGDLQGTAIGRFLSEPRTLIRTPEWCPSPQKGAARNIDVSTISTPLNELYLELERRTTASPDHHAVDVSPSKQKVKTRGTPGREAAVRKPKTAQDKVRPSSSAAPATKQNIKISVDARALKVLRTLFYQPSIGSTGAETPWKDFVHALVSVGFAAQKLYGSVWHFSPTASFPAAPTTLVRPDDNIKRRKSAGNAIGEDMPAKSVRGIHFHESHPGKIPFNTARRHGRRLARAYGWDGTMFGLKDK